MSIATVLTAGYGNGTFNGTIPLVLTEGYGIGAAVAAVVTPARDVIVPSESIRRVLFPRVVLLEAHGELLLVGRARLGVLRPAEVRGRLTLQSSTRLRRVRGLNFRGTLGLDGRTRLKRVLAPIDEYLLEMEDWAILGLPFGGRET